MVLLAIDTSSNTLSAALLNNTDTFFIERQMLRGQGEALIPLI
jgi:tRNA A37 threonylcarbamoyladenosine modification protein TsaB